MRSRTLEYRWWLLDGDLAIVSDGKVAGVTLPAALADLTQKIDKHGFLWRQPSRRPFSLIVYQGPDVVAWRPFTIGIC